MTREEADNVADWANLDGGDAFALIDRHGSNFHDANELMEAFARARVKAEIDSIISFIKEQIDYDLENEVCAKARGARTENDSDQELAQLRWWSEVRLWNSAHEKIIEHIRARGEQ